MKGKSEGKGEAASLIFWKGQGESGENPTQPNMCRTNWLRESQNQRVTSVDNAVIGLMILNALDIVTQISLLGQMINHFQIARTAEPAWWLNGLDNLASFLRSNLREHSVCTKFCLAFSMFSFRCAHPSFSCCHWHGSSNTGSDWWANYKSLLEDFGLKHEIDETREAERYKFGDGGTLVSSIRVTAPHFCCWQERQNCFQRGSFETPALVDWSRFSDSCPSCCGYGRKDAQDWNWRR